MALPDGPPAFSPARELLRGLALWLDDGTRSLQVAMAATNGELARVWRAEDEARWLIAPCALVDPAGTAEACVRAVRRELSGAGSYRRHAENLLAEIERARTCGEAGVNRLLERTIRMRRFLENDAYLSNFDVLHAAVATAEMLLHRTWRASSAQTVVSLLAHARGRAYGETSKSSREVLAVVSRAAERELRAHLPRDLPPQIPTLLGC